LKPSAEGSIEAGSFLYVPMKVKGGRRESHEQHCLRSVIGLKKELKEGDKVTITLEFSGDLRKTITVPVKPLSAMVKEG